MAKILYVLSNAGDQPGGIAVYTEFFCKVAIENGNTVHFLADGNLSEERMEHYRSLSNEGKVFSITSKLDSRVGNVKSLKKFFKASRNTYDIIYFNLSSFHYCPALYFAGRETKSEIIVHGHSAGSGFIDIKSPLRRMLSIINRNIWANKIINKKVACSLNAGEYLFGGKVGKLIIIHNPVDIEKYRYNEKNKISFREEFSLGASDYVVGTVGNLYPIKNHPFMIRAFSKAIKMNDHLKYVIVGSGPMEEELRRMVASLGIADKVIFAGQRTDIPRCLAGIDCFLFASKREGLGIAGVEAQAAGCYCLFSEKIPDETKTTNTTEKLRLDTCTWAKKMAKETRVDREENYKQTNEKTFNYNVVRDKVFKELLSR